METDITKKIGVPKEVITDLRSVINQQKKMFSEWSEHEERATKSKEGHKPYVIYDDNLEDLEGTFIEIMGGYGFESYLRQRFSEKIGDLIGVELGGPGSNFFGDFSKGIFAQTFGVTIKDLRLKYQTVAQRERDEQYNHSVIEADIFSKNGLKNLDKQLAGRKIDFLVERMSGGWGVNVQSMSLFAKYFSYYYERLGENGCMFLQTPDEFENIENVTSYNTWKNLLQQKYGNVINIDIRSKVIKIEKIKGSPDKISTLRF